RFDDLFHELYENGGLPENGELVHRLEIDRDKERPLQFWIDTLAAFDVEDLWNFEQLHSRVHHHLLDASGSDLGLEPVEDDVMNHGKLKLLGVSGRPRKWASARGGHVFIRWFLKGRAAK